MRLTESIKKLVDSVSPAYKTKIIVGSLDASIKRSLRTTPERSLNDSLKVNLDASLKESLK